MCQQTSAAKRSLFVRQITFASFGLSEHKLNLTTSNTHSRQTHFALQFDITGAPQIKLRMRSQCQELGSKKHATHATQLLESWHTVTRRQSSEMQGKKAWNATGLHFWQLKWQQHLLFVHRNSNYIWPAHYQAFIKEAGCVPYYHKTRKFEAKKEGITKTSRTVQASRDQPGWAGKK